MFCSNCGCKLDEDSLFCPECGAKVRKVAPAANDNGMTKPAALSVSAAYNAESVSAGSISPENSSFSTLAIAALAAAVLSIVFAICSLRISMTWMSLIAAVILAFICFIRLKFDSLVMAVPISLFALMVVISSVRIFKLFRYYTGLAVVLTILPFIFAIGAAVIYWLLVFGKDDKRKMVVAEIVMLAGYAILSITSTLSGGAVTFRLAASRLSAIFFMMAYILRIIESSEVFAPMGSSGSYSESSFSGNGDYQKYPHPYHELGGYLKFTVIGGTIVCILGIVAMIVEMIPVFKILSYASRYARLTFLYIIMILLIIVSIVLYGLIIKLLMMIKNKDQRFLWFYHKLVISLTLVAFVLQWISGGFGKAFLFLILYGLMFFLYTLYFVKSVRVRTYMQSDEYLRIDPLTRNVPSPRPADMEPYTGPQ